MRRYWLPLVALTVAVTAGAPHAAPATPTPIVVELFTSEGCSDCPPADVLLQKLIETSPVGGADIIGLSQHVDYWDRLGWKDRFSSAALTNRQREYAAHFGGDSIYTPQMIVDGRTEFVGSDASAARRAIDKALARPHTTVHLALDGDQPAASAAIAASATDLSPGSHDRSDLVLVVTEDGLRSDVKRGENRGRVLTHAAVVRYMATAGVAGAAPVHATIALSPEWQRNNLRIVAFVQERQSRAILGAASIALKTAQ